MISPGDTVALKAAVAAGLNLFIEINNAEFADEDPYEAKTMHQLVVELHKYDDFVKERLSSLSERLRSTVRPRTHHLDECTYCLQNATGINGDDLRCLFCGHVIAVRDFAELISDNGTVETCPSCRRQSVSKHLVNGHESTYECLCCGYHRVGCSFPIQL